MDQRGLLLIERTETEKVLSLLKELRPHETEHALTRMGGIHDGGYLIPDDLEGIEGCFSPGVDVTSSFERECYDKGMKVFLADASVQDVGPELAANQYSFLKKFIGSSSDGDFITIEDWIALYPEISEKKNLLLQMDIEGFEYETLIETPERVLNRFQIICIEAHSLTGMWEPNFFKFIELAFKKLTRNHICVHIHPNNASPYYSKTFDGVEIPNCMEFTFLRKDCISHSKRASQFPHPLDADNIPSSPTVVLPRVWYD